MLADFFAADNNSSVAPWWQTEIAVHQGTGNRFGDGSSMICGQDGGSLQNGYIGPPEYNDLHQSVTNAFAFIGDDVRQANGVVGLEVANYAMPVNHVGKGNMEDDVGQEVS